MTTPSRMQFLDEASNFLCVHSVQDGRGTSIHSPESYLDATSLPHLASITLGAAGRPQRSRIYAAQARRPGQMAVEDCRGKSQGIPRSIQVSFASGRLTLGEPLVRGWEGWRMCVMALTTNGRRLKNYCLPQLSATPATRKPGAFESNYLLSLLCSASPGRLETRRKIAHGTKPTRMRAGFIVPNKWKASTDRSRSLYLCTRRSQGTNHWTGQAKHASSRDEGVRGTLVHMPTMHLSPDNPVGQPSRIPQMRRALGPQSPLAPGQLAARFLVCIHRYLVYFPVPQSLGRRCLPRRKNRRDFERCISASPSAS